MVMMIMMMYVLVNVPPAGRGRRCRRILRELAFQPAHDLRHRASLILLSGRVLQLVLLAGPAVLLLLLRLDELLVVALQVVAIVDRSLMIGRLLIVGREIDDVAMGGDAAAGGDVTLLRRHVVVNRRRHDHVTTQQLRIPVSLGGVRRVVPRGVVPRLPEVRPRLGRRFGKQRGMISTAFPNRLVVVCGRLTRLQKRLAILIIVIRGFHVRAVRRNACLFVLMPFPA